MEPQQQQHPTHIELPFAVPAAEANWRVVQLRVTLVSGRSFVAAAGEVARLFPAAGDEAVPEWALEALAQLRTHITFLGKSGHTQIERAS